jgi:hypothetical protein
MAGLRRAKRRRSSNGYGPAIHVLLVAFKKDVDARDVGERSDAVLADGYARA